MRLSWTFTLAACLAAGGCATGSGAQWEDYYTLGPAPPAAVAATPPAGSDQAGARPSLRVERIGAPAWLQSPRIYYRLLYHEGSEVATQRERL